MGSKALGKPVEYRPQSMEQFEKDFGPARAGIFEYLRNGFFSRVSPGFYNIVGRRPTTYHEYLTQTTPTGTTGLQELYEGNIWKKGHDAMAEASKMKLSRQGCPAVERFCLALTTAGDNQG